MNDEKWRYNLDKAVAYNVPHISSYCLTVEPKTLLEKQVKRGLLKGVNEEQAAAQFEILMQTLENAGFEHYEISNFSKPDAHARHNSNYWLGQKYLGIGPSAHSYDGVSRQHNIANNQQYMTTLNDGVLNFEKENLSPAQRYNEYVLTTLRTKWGAHWSKIAAFDLEYSNHFKDNIFPFIEKKQVIESNGVYTLSREGRMLADYIAVELFI